MQPRQHSAFGEKAVANELGKAEDETAQKLILAGMELFGQYGFKGTTTRMIAEAADSNIGSIAYYFDNKTGLYHAIARHIARAHGGDITLANHADGGLVVTLSLPRQETITGL